MAKAKNIIIGILILAVLATSATIYFGNDLKISVGKMSTTFYYNFLS